MAYKKYPPPITTVCVTGYAKKRQPSTYSYRFFSDPPPITTGKAFDPPPITTEKRPANGQEAVKKAYPPPITTGKAFDPPPITTAFS